MERREKVMLQEMSEGCLQEKVHFEKDALSKERDEGDRIKEWKVLGL